jgi:hypothetical protein
MAKPKHHSVLQEGDFQDYGTAKPDSKHRIVLKGAAVGEHYRIYRNDAGQILLDPQVMIPAREAWLYKDKKALASVRRGIKQAEQGKIVKLPSLAPPQEDSLLAKIAQDRFRKASFKRVSWEDLKP